MSGAHWDEFARHLAELVGVDPARVRPESRLVGDLGLDSIGIAEAVVMLLADYQLDGLSERVQTSDWQDVTVGVLYDEYRSGRKGGDWQVRAE